MVYVGPGGCMDVAYVDSKQRSALKFDPEIAPHLC